MGGRGMGGKRHGKQLHARVEHEDDVLVAQAAQNLDLLRQSAKQRVRQERA